ncbi:MoxR family ATPase [Steroidobacter sp. S1-65]|uniref:MoxR family ATPase n=1 Tax=Steroidobacter gossypii TaxID=2805490 RepID=A0ABS1X043_9GAMM|nr:MoxR family ATPase [Steroidobacter gossypii]MBM0106574.1 MoxR family ATPase [Steroidobacter gossypii]
MRSERVSHVHVETGQQGGAQWSSRVRGEIGKAVLGQLAIIERLQIALLTGGHVLLEGMPGLAKTLLVKSLSQALGMQFERIQFTPDLLPSDIVGTMVYSPGDGRFSPHRGPIFANLVLADEINRAPAKVQSALLEAMQERQVTLGGVTYELPSPFLVMATQNPVEQEGTYPLPEAQLDRFLFKLLLDYPSELEELQMVQRWGSVTSHPELLSVSSGDELLRLRQLVDRIHVAESVQAYVVKLVRATRAIASGAQKTLSYGASPRACLGLFQASKALAWLRDADYVTPALVQEVFSDVMRHRVGLTYEAESRGLSADRILRDILDQTPVPESGGRDG